MGQPRLKGYRFVMRGCPLASCASWGGACERGVNMVEQIYESVCKVVVVGNCGYENIFIMLLTGV